MSIAVNELFKAKPFPKWFTDHPIFKEVDKVKKVFPGIGLPNCEQEINVDNVEPAKTAAEQFLKTVTGKLSSRIDSLKEYIEKRPEMSAERKAQGAKCLALLEAVLQLLTGPFSKDGKAKVSIEDIKSKKKLRESFLQNNNGRLAIKLPSDITLEGEERPILRENESFFRVYNKLNELLREGRFTAMTKLEDLEAFKTFSTDNIPNNKFKIVFSSEGVDGSWDVVTMSMRGVTSCQNWDNGEYKHCTIGSLLDPFVGIIYLTSGSKYNKYGSKMMKRSIVRFVINSKTNKPYLLLDNMYPSFDSKIFTQFKKFLSSKIGDMEINYAPNMDQKILQDSYMPLTELRKKLGTTYGRVGSESSNYDDDDDDEEDNDDYDDGVVGDIETLMSYQDVHIKNKNSSKKDKHSELFEKNSIKKRNSFITKFIAATTTAIKTSSADDYPESLKIIINRLQGKDKKNGNYSYIVPEVARVLANSFVKDVDRASFTNSDIYLRRIYMNYFNNKTKIVNTVKTKMAGNINGRLALKEKNKLRSENIISLMKVIFPIIDIELKKELNDLLSKKKTSTPIPLP